MRINIVLTKSDGDVARFLRSLPKGKRNETVIKILRHAVRGHVAELTVEPNGFSATEERVGIDLPKDLVKQCKEKPGFEKFTTGVKAEILRCIRKNYKEPPSRFVTLSEVQEMAVKANGFIENQKERYSDSPDKQRQLLKAYRFLVRRLSEHFETTEESR